MSTSERSFTSGSPKRVNEKGSSSIDTVIDLSAKQTEQAIANAGKTSERDADRSSNNPDISGNARQPKGEGRAQQ